jgi:hypothetical protein
MRVRVMIGVSQEERSAKADGEAAALRLDESWG